MSLPTPLRFQPIEVLPAATATSLPQSLQITPTPLYYKALVVRLLSGTIDVRCHKSNKLVEQRSNYSTLSWTVNRRVTKKLIKDVLGGSSFSKYDSFVRSTLKYNRNFYQQIFFEFCGYFFETQQNNHLAAFVHLYRVLERISYSFPLLWAARAINYEKTFATLRGYFTDPKVGELAVFKKFIPTFIEKSELQTHVTFNITSPHTDWQERYYETLKSVLQSLDGIVSGTPKSQITTRYECLIDLTITIRNRYFHALTGHSNSFGAGEIADFNEFCSIFNQDIANWLAFILFQVFEFELQ